MSGTYLYCQNQNCGEYLGSLGGDSCRLCGWCSGRSEEEADADVSDGVQGRDGPQ